MLLAGDMQGAELRTERLILRPPRRSDCALLDAAVRETAPELARWLPWAREGHSWRDSKRYIRSAQLARTRRVAFEFVIEPVESGEFLGMVSLHRLDWFRRCGGLGYWVRRSHWKRGVATEAAGALIEHAFRDLKLHRIEAHVAVSNPGSQRVADKLGFKREGIARDAELIGDRYVDHVQYGLLCSDRLRAVADDEEPA